MKTMESDLVSVIIPTYNRKILEKTVQSVLDQTYTNIEIIIVDDHSNIPVEISLGKLTKNSKIKIYRLKENKGAPFARNYGFSKSSGKFITFLDDDDEWYPSKISLQLKKFQELSNDFGLVYCGSNVYNTRKKRVEFSQIPKYAGYIKAKILNANFINSSTPLIRRMCFNDNQPFDEKFKSCQDWEAWTKIAETYKFAYVNKILTKYNIHPRQLTKNYNNVIIGRLQYLRKFYREISKSRIILSNHFYEIANLMMLSNRRSFALQLFRNAIFLNPKNLKSIFHLLFAKLCPFLFDYFMDNHNYKTNIIGLFLIKFFPNIQNLLRTLFVN